MEEFYAELEQVIETEICPVLRGHGGAARFLECSEDGVVSIELSGACVGCPSADFGTRQFIEEELKARFPQVSRVEICNPVAQELLDMAWEMLFGKDKEA